jgi:hypothetical protein
MNRYIATFYSHFGAMSYYNSITKQGISAKLMPVPRKVSASCGTCVSYEHTTLIDSNDCELDCVYKDVDGKLGCELKK